MTAADASGNTATTDVEEEATITVTVPHDQKGKKRAKPAVGPVPTDEEGGAEGVTEKWVFGLENYPNPFNSATAIRYTLPEASRVRLVIYNALGQQVLALVDAAQAAGVHTVQWDGRDASGREVRSGVYLYRLNAGPNVAVGKMILIK